MTRFTAYPVPPAPHPAASLTIVDRIVAICGAAAHALIALVLRIVIARAFFVDGQAKIVGPVIALPIRGYDLGLILPAGLRAETLDSFATRFAAVPVSPSFISYGFAYAEFLLPICLFVGFSARLAALILAAMTIVMQVYIDPNALWTAHAYWFSILLVLMMRGPGAISLDRLIRYLYLK